MNKGDSITISASGKIYQSSGREESAGPEGTFAVDSWLTDYTFVKEWGHESLIVRIGSTGNTIYIGKGTTFTAPNQGALWVGVNDKDPANNGGSFSVTIKVE